MKKGHGGYEKKSCRNLFEIRIRNVGTIDLVRPVSVAVCEFWFCSAKFGLCGRLVPPQMKEGHGGCQRNECGIRN